MAEDPSIGDRRTLVPGARAAGVEPIGSRIAGRYEIVSVLGQGGMGVVYECRDLQLGRRVAVKRMLVTTGGHERFLREARVVAALDHPGIVAVHNLGADAQGPYIDMAFLQGADLGRWVKQHGALAPQELLRVAREICRALAYAHGRDVIHRDRTTAPARVERLAKPPHRPNLDSGGPLDRSLSRGEHSYGGRRRAHPADVIRLEFLSPLKMGIKHQKKRIEELRKENERAWTRVSKLEYHVCRLILDLYQGRI